MNVGLAFASAAKTVLFIDADAQENATSAALDINSHEQAFDNDGTVYGCLKPVINSTDDIKPIAPPQISMSAPPRAADATPDSRPTTMSTTTTTALPVLR